MPKNHDTPTPSELDQNGTHESYGSAEFLDRGKKFLRLMGARAHKAASETLTLIEREIGTKPGEYIGKKIRVIREIGVEAIQDTLDYLDEKIPDPFEWADNKRQQRETKKIAKDEDKNIRETIAIADYDDAVSREKTHGHRRSVTSVDEIFGTTSGKSSRARRRIAQTESRIDKAESMKDEPSFSEQWHDHRQRVISQKLENLHEKMADMPDDWRRRRLANIASELKFKNSVHANYSNKLQNKRLGEPELFEKKVDSAVKKEMRKMYEKVLARRMDELGIDDMFARSRFVANLSKKDKSQLAREAIRQLRGRNIVEGKIQIDELSDIDLDIANASAKRDLTDHYSRIE